MMCSQELHLVDVCPFSRIDARVCEGNGITERPEYQAACRHQAGKIVREVVSQLPRLRRLRLKGVKIDEHGEEFANLHPWTHLE